MAKNYVQRGDTITLTAPYAVSSGGGLLVGGIFGVATADAAIGADVEAATVGVWDLAKASAQAWTQGVAVYWDNATKLVTTVSTNNTFIGYATQAAANPSATGRVKLVHATA